MTNKEKIFILNGSDTEAFQLPNSILATINLEKLGFDTTEVGNPESGFTYNLIQEAIHQNQLQGYK